MDIQQILKDHKEYLKTGDGSKRANLKNADLEDVDLEGADLRDANLEDVNLEGANLRGAFLEGANLRGAFLEGANLRGANLNYADLWYAYLECANLNDAYLESAFLRSADLRGANLYGAYLKGADLCWAKLKGAFLERANLENLKNFPEFEKTNEGELIVYKTFNPPDSTYKSPDRWVIKEGSIIEEPNIERDRRIECGPGINVAPLEWVRSHYSGAIWELHVEEKDMTVPYSTDGKVRCSKAKIIRRVG